MKKISRKKFLALAVAGTATIGGVALFRRDDPGPRYTQADKDKLAKQWLDDAAQSGKGPFGEHRYKGYRGLAELPWFEIDDKGVLRNVATGLPKAIDMHCHLGSNLLMAPDVDLQQRTDRVEHLLDCDATDPGCDLDLDIYINGNFTKAALREMKMGIAKQFLWGNPAASTRTIPNLAAEMDASGVEKTLILPIAFGLPFGDNLTELWNAAIKDSDHTDRFLTAASVHPKDGDRIEKLRRYAKTGARAVKLHPTMQRVYPDSDAMMEIYAECERLGLIVFYHCGRAGIEPESSHRYALPRHYEAAVKAFPKVQFVLGHSGARDVADAIPLAERHENVWLDTHGQGVTILHEMLERTGGTRMLYGTDWPFYHLAASLAKLLIITEKRPKERQALLRGNAERLLGLTPS